MQQKKRYRINSGNTGPGITMLTTS